jgi:hypothetical protein
MENVFMGWEQGMLCVQVDTTRGRKENKYMFSESAEWKWFSV